MAVSTRIESLNILLDTAGKDLLKEEYGKVIQNIQKTTISNLLKNTDLSGDPTAGSVEAKRFVNVQSQPYGTARAANKGQAVKAKPVPVQINVDRELIEEVEEKDVAFYGVEGVIQRAIARQQLSLQRELERAFFLKAKTQGTSLSTGETEINKIVEGVIQQIETTKNDWVDGVPRDMIHLVCDTNTYGIIRDDLDRGVQNANVNTAVADFKTYHGVSVYSSVYLPTGVKITGMCQGSIAQPIKLSLADPIKIQLSDAYAFGLFFYYGVEAVMPDLIVTYE